MDGDRLLLAAYRLLVPPNDKIHAYGGLKGALSDMRIVSAVMYYHSEGTSISWIRKPCRTPYWSSVSVLSGSSIA